MILIARKAFTDSKKCRRACPQECNQKKYPIRVETIKLGTNKKVSVVKKKTGWETPKAKEYIE